LLRRPLTIFNYEIKRMRWKADLPNPRRQDMARIWQVLRWLILTILIGVVIGRINRPAAWSIASAWAFVVLLGPWIVGLIADLYTVSNVVMFWRSRAREEELDILRLTMPNDEVLLDNMRAAAEVAVWGGMRWETALRSFLPLCGFIVCAGVGIVLIFSYGQTRVPREMPQLAFGLSMILWLVRLFFLYVREPLWRMRTLVALSIAVASRTREGNSGVLIASGIAACLKVVQIAVVTMLILATVNLFTFDWRYREYEAALWLIAGSAIVPWGIHFLYAVLHGWCTLLTLYNLVGEEVTFAGSFRLLKTALLQMLPISKRRAT
jgi:hypothetical protein